MNVNDHAWQRLARAARLAPEQPASEAPFGFTQRVVARWLAGEAAPASPWELALSWRPLACAALVMLLSVAMNFAAVRDQLLPDPATPAELLSLLEE
jgi:hypothetical protein